MLITRGDIRLCLEKLTGEPGRTTPLFTLIRSRDFLLNTGGGWPTGVQAVRGQLKEELQGELNLSHVGAGSSAGDNAEAALTQCGAGIGKIRLVQKVKEFGPEL